MRAGNSCAGGGILLGLYLAPACRPAKRSRRCGARMQNALSDTCLEMRQQDFRRVRTQQGMNQPTVA